MPLNLSLPLSAHFTLRELLRSTAAERDPALKSEQENPPEEVVESLQHLVQRVLEPIRVGIAAPMIINSGYRCLRVNELIKGSATSQHCRGEAADCELLPSFLTDAAMAATKASIRADVERRIGRRIRADVDQNFYLFAFVCLHLAELDIDQVIHEFGDGFGRPAWVHVSASRRQDRREVLFIGSYTNNRYRAASVDEALGLCAG